MAKRAAVLTGSFGGGHDVIAQACIEVLERLDWETRTLESMSLLGPIAGQVGERVFRRLLKLGAAYDALHFGHMRTGSRLADLMDRLATGRLVPALRKDFARAPVDLTLSVFATGASAAAKLKPESPQRRTVVLCTDAVLHRLWVTEGTDLFLVTSVAAAASVRRFLPRALVAVVPRPVRHEFYTAPSQADARASLHIDVDQPCVLLMGGGWGLGPLVETARTLARAGVHVFAVAGNNGRLENRLRALARREPLVAPYGFTNEIPLLMAAADLVITHPGATTCSEARVLGRQLLLLDVMPGHGRDNLQHELELGAAEVSNPAPAEVTASVLAALDRISHPARPSDRPVDEWERAFAEALALIGVDISPLSSQDPSSRAAQPGSS